MSKEKIHIFDTTLRDCLLYTSDAADDMQCVDLGGRRIIKKKVLIPEDYLSPLYDDLNTPGYIANLHKLFEKSQKGSTKDKEIFVSACNFIGLLNESKNSWDQFKQSKSKISEEEINQKIAERNKARKNKDYKAADEIRNELLDKGVLIEDKDDKTLWKFK